MALETSGFVPLVLAREKRAYTTIVDEQRRCLGQFYDGHAV